jgi:O-antigen ligase
MFLNRAAENGGLGTVVPDSTVSIYNHKPGNVAVHVAIALAFVWLVPGIRRRSRTVLTGLGTVLLLIVATQNRGGFVAAAAGLAVAWLFAKRRGRMTLVMIMTVLAIIVAGWGFNVQIRGEQGRTVSVEQLFQNVGSLTGSDSAQAAGNLDSNVQFRNHLWHAVIAKVKHDKKVLIGLGFGPNIAAELGFKGEATPELRSPHNSHIDVFARMGAIGALMWAALWALWYSIALRTRLRLRAAGRAVEKGLVEVCVVGVTAIMVNAYFDPTLESPQVALWLWTLVGITLGLAVIGRRSSIFAHQEPAPA